MRELTASITKIAPSSAGVLIRGESGSGKELVARAIHRMSDRSDKPFRAINCAALPAELLESELFGHKKGAFTGAESKHVGLFEASNGGTIFLDEIGDMPIILQSKLLRFLQDSKIRPVGANDEIQIDVRILAATHQNLEGLVEQKKFREDLFFRLNVIPLWVPPLRERTSDIEPLVKTFVKKYSDLHHKAAKSVDAEVLRELATYKWPGNVRELENAVERAVLLAEGPTLELKDFSWLKSRAESIQANHSADAAMIHDGVFQVPLSVSLKELETQYILAYCRAHPHLTQEGVANGLGINRKTLYRKFHEYRQNSQSLS